MRRLKNYVAGRLVEPVAGRQLEVVEPATGQAYALVPDSEAADVELAVEAAEKAFPAWSRTPASQRSRLLLDIAERIERNLEALARAESVDTGKPIALARGLDIPRAAANFRFFATAILHERSDLHRTDGTGIGPEGGSAALNYTLRRPRGVAGLISPWNLPLYLLSWKVAPALASGNTAVAKPSELTPMTAYLLSQLCIEAGLPPGVLNVVHGLGAKAGAALAGHPRVPALSFTGGTITGAKINSAAAPLFKRVSLELGGKNPNLVFADADLNEAVPASLRAAFSNQGQICLSGSRILVEEKAFGPFVEKLVAAAKRLKVGDPMEETTEQGALASASHLDKVRSYAELAGREGGTIHCGGGPPKRLPERCRGGYFFEPTVVTGLAAASRLHREEVFGPLVTVQPFRDEEEALRLANATEYGLAATLWTRDLARAHRVAERLEAGTVWVNCWLLRDLRVPFGGVKRSGVGREGGEEAMRFFTEPKNVCVRVPLEAGSAP